MTVTGGFAVARYNYHRLSAQDTSFLLLEKDNVLMHAASTTIFQTGPLRSSNGGIDFPRIKKAVNDALHRIPRYRQKLMWIRKNRKAIWIDDDQFKLDYHVRHTSLPKPGSQEQLRSLSARIIESKLDRAKPLWELWVVEGLEGDRFALINKTHHCMVDGESIVDLSKALMSVDPGYQPENPPVFSPHQVPTKTELLTEEYKRWVSLPWKLTYNWREFRKESEDIYHDLTTHLHVLKDTFKHLSQPPSATPLNGSPSTHRVLDWLVMDLSEIKSLRRILGCTVNDIVLTIITGAIKRFFQDRKVDSEKIEFRAAAPVSMRGQRERKQQKINHGTQISSWSVPLPINEDDPLNQLEKITEITQDLKDSKQALGVDMMMSIAEWTPGILPLSARIGAASNNNTIITNVSGPQFPMYFLGAKMEEIYPIVPLMNNMGVTIALFSYHGKLFWGFNADSNRVSDLASFVKNIEYSLENLKLASELEQEKQDQNISQEKHWHHSEDKEPLLTTSTASSGFKIQPVDEDPSIYDKKSYDTKSDKKRTGKPENGLPTQASLNLSSEVKKVKQIRKKSSPEQKPGSQPSNKNPRGLHTKHTKVINNAESSPLTETDDI